MNIIIIIASIVVIVVMIEIEQVENGSFQNQTESPLARRLPQAATKSWQTGTTTLGRFEVYAHLSMYMYACIHIVTPTTHQAVTHLFTVIALKPEASC